MKVAAASSVSVFGTRRVGLLLPGGRGRSFRWWIPGIDPTEATPPESVNAVPTPPRGGGGGGGGGGCLTANDDAGGVL